MAKRTGGILPFLKWAGGKRWLSSALTPYLRECRGTYFEPFLGSGAIFFDHLPQVAHLSDTNDDLIECYEVMRDQHEIVERELKVLANREPDKYYYDVRAERPSSAAGRAARFIYLNRTCWNGLYRVNLKGEFNVPRGTKTQIILPTDDFSKVSQALKATTLRTSDFADTISMAGRGDVVFADPPYTVAHNMNGFVKYNQKIFGWDDQLRLASALKDAAKRGVLVISTNADHPEVKALYEPIFEVQSIARASIIAAASGNRRKTTELFITNSAMVGV
jgi:DNA adenine methylase